MNDNASNRPIKAEVSRIDSPSKVLDSQSTGWTDEKHNLYLSSIEASFVNQLHSSKYNSKDLLGSLSRTQICRNSSGSNASSLTYGQFKVLQAGCWKNLKFKRAKGCKDIENEPCSLSSNPWIWHFRSTCSGKEIHLTSNQVDDRVLASRSNKVATQRHRREAINTNQPLSCPHICLQDSVGSTTEVSDQNFVDDEFEQMKQSSMTHRKKRQRTAVADQLINDQVVPSQKLYATPSSGENHVCLNEGNAECSSKISERTSSFLPVGPERSSIKDQELKCQLM